MALKTSLKQQYFNNENKYILPADAGANNRDLAATVAANFASLTYRMPNEDIEALSHARAEDIVSFYQEYRPMLEERIGANQEYHPFYPNFPEETMNISDVEVFFDQLIYGLSGFAIRPEVYEQEETRFPYMGITSSHRMTAGSEKDYIDSVRKAMYSPIAYTPQQLHYIQSFYQEYPLGDNNHRRQYLPDASRLSHHENRVVLACMLKDEKTFSDKQLQSLLTDTNDIVRYMAVRSAQTDYEKGNGRILELIHNEGYEKKDFYYYASLRYAPEQAPSFNVPRKERGFVVNALEHNAQIYGASALERTMMQNKKVWKRIIKNLHIGDYPNAKYTQRAFQTISTNQVVERTSRTVEEAIKNNDLGTALAASAKQPGDFVRRFDKFLRMGLKKGDVSFVIRTLREVTPHASVQTLLSLTAHMQKRTAGQEERVFRIAKSNKQFRIEDNRAVISPLIAGMIHDACIYGITEQMKGKDVFHTVPDAKIYISPKSADYKVPMDVREMSEGTHSYTQGSTIDVSTTADYRRFFVWWTNTKDTRVDIDLSLNLYTNNSLVGIVSWNEQYHMQDAKGNKIAVFSGDIQDGGPENGKGAAEFVDLNLKGLRELGITRIVPVVNSFCQQPFKAMPNLSFGYMDRDSILRNNMDGQLFEPSTVETKFDLRANATSCIPCVFLVDEPSMDKENELGMNMLWMDYPYQGRVASRDVTQIDMLVEQQSNNAFMSVAELARINAEANDVPLIANPAFADYLFVTEKELEEIKELYPEVDFDNKIIILPTDINYIVGELLPTANQMSRTKEQPSIDMESLISDEIDTETKDTRMHEEER